jgi:hypothetical protein
MRTLLVVAELSMFGNVSSSNALSRNLFLELITFKYKMKNS